MKRIYYLPKSLTFTATLLLLIGAPTFAQTVNGVTVITGGIELSANKDAASGYAGLTAGVLLKTAEFPAFTGDATSSAGGVALTVVKINGTTLSSLATGILKNTTSTGVPSIAAVGDITGLFTSCSGIQYLGFDGTCHSAGTGTVTSVSGTANQIASTGGTTPVLSIPSVVIFPGIYEDKVNTVTFSATPTFDLTLGNVQKITLTGNVTSGTASNHAAGERVSFLVCQDATGGRTFVWPTTVKGAPIIGSTLSTCTAVTFIDDGTNLYATGIGVTNM